MPWVKRAVQRFCPGLVVATVLLCGPGARAGGILWYNGDPDGRDALENATNLASTYNGGTLYNAFVYDNFIVPTGQTWTITSVFSNIEVTNFTTPPTTATWQILSGVSAGNGGTTVAAGDGAATLTPNGFPPVNPTNVASTLSETISPVVLKAGTYWLSVAPDITSPFYFANFAGISTTGGANAIGNPPGNDGNSFINTVGLPAAIGYDFVPTSVVEGGGTWDYSLGLSGTFTSTTIPEPSSLTLGGIVLCLCGLSVAGRRLIAREPGRAASQR